MNFIPSRLTADRFYYSDDSERHAAEMKAKAHDERTLADAESWNRRAMTSKEIMQGYLDREDDRDMSRKIADANWKPKVLQPDDETRFSRMKADLGLADPRVVDAMKTGDRNERLGKWLDRMHEQELAPIPEPTDLKGTQEYKQLLLYRDSARWDSEVKQSEHTLITQAIAQHEVDNADPQAAKALFEQVKAVRTQREFEWQAARQGRINSLMAEVEAEKARRSKDVMNEQEEPTE